MSKQERDKKPRWCCVSNCVFPLVNIEDKKSKIIGDKRYQHICRSSFIKCLFDRRDNKSKETK